MILLRFEITSDDYRYCIKVLVFPSKMEFPSWTPDTEGKETYANYVNETKDLNLNVLFIFSIPKDFSDFPKLGYSSPV
jgi:hypothetical protein